MVIEKMIKKNLSSKKSIEKKFEDIAVNEDYIIDLFSDGSCILCLQREQLYKISDKRIKMLIKWLDEARSLA